MAGVDARGGGGEMTWRVQRPCDECPFNASGKGLHLRKSLLRGRWQEILASLRMESWFPCHKTVEDTGGDGSDLMCAGAIAWQNKRGLSSQLQRVCERMDAIKIPPAR